MSKLSTFSLKVGGVNTYLRTAGIKPGLSQADWDTQSPELKGSVTKTLSLHIIEFPGRIFLELMSSQKGHPGEWGTSKHDSP